jgi:hypothetical protein
MDTRCPKCGMSRPIRAATDEGASESWCTVCGASFPGGGSPAVSTETATPSDERVIFGVLGFLLGAVVGFLTRPSETLPVAQASFNQVMFLGLIGAAAGIAIGWAVRLAFPGLSTQSNADAISLAANAETVTNQTVMNMVKAGLGDELILEKLKYSRCAFSLSSTDLAQLKERGISDRVIARMLQTQARIESPA